MKLPERCSDLYNIMMPGEYVYEICYEDPGKTSTYFIGPWAWGSFGYGNIDCRDINWYEAVQDTFSRLTEVKSDPKVSMGAYSWKEIENDDDFYYDYTVTLDNNYFIPYSVSDKIYRIAVKRANGAVEPVLY